MLFYRRVGSCALRACNVMFSEAKLLYGDELLRKKVKVPEHTALPGPEHITLTHPAPKTFYPELTETDPRLCQLISQARNSTDSMNRTVVLEGTKLISDALSSGGRVLALYFSCRSLLTGLDLSKRVDSVFYVPQRILQRFSLLKTSPGILAVFLVPDPSCLSSGPLISSIWRPLPVTLIINGIRDPGNMGSLLRTAAAFGLSSVLVSKGSVDVWNDKVIRAGMSAHFRVPIFHNLNWSDIAQRIFGNAASSVGSNQPKVYAADISCELTERFLRTDLGDATEPCGFDNPLSAENVTVGSTDENASPAVPNAFHRFLSNPSPTAYRLPLNICPHFSVNYFDHSSRHLADQRSSPLALIVGSETDGLSLESYYLAHLTGGSRVVVPSSPDTESLNAASAVSIILGEMQRQYLQL